MKLFGALLLGSILVACGSNTDSNDQAHRAQAWANHLHRLAWQKAHPTQWAAEKARLRKEAARRIELEQEARAAASARAAAQAQYAAAHTPCKEFGRGLDSIQAGNVLAGYDCKEVVSGAYLIHVTVRDEAWEAFDYDQRLGLAKGLWAACVKFAHPEQADSCHVKLVGEQGEDLGGSNDFAGSMIDVSKD